jgi:hypothetical protein
MTLDAPLALDAFLGEHRHCWWLHGDGLQQDGAWLFCACGARLWLGELPQSNAATT